MKLNPFGKFIREIKNELEAIDLGLNNTWFFELGAFDRFRAKVEKAISKIEQAKSVVAGHSVNAPSEIWDAYFDDLTDILSTAESIKTKINRRDWVSSLLDSSKKFESGISLVDSLVNRAKGLLDFATRAYRKLLGPKDDD